MLNALEGDQASSRRFAGVGKRSHRLGLVALALDHDDHTVAELGVTHVVPGVQTRWSRRRWTSPPGAGRR